MNPSNSNTTTNNSRIKLNVGGKLFETTLTTLQSGGPDSLLSLLSTRPVQTDPIFIDRDPDIFSSLLSLLRSNRLPSLSQRFSKHELIDEATYYGIESRVKSALSPIKFNGIDASILTSVSPASNSLVTDFNAVDSDGSVWIAHGGQVSVYDWNLCHSGTVRTHMEYISCIKRIGDDIAVIGSEREHGLHFYNLANSSRVGVVDWSDESDPRIYKAKVHAVGDSGGEAVFASFDCSNRENCVLMVDKSRMEVSLEIGRQSRGAAKTAVVNKLNYVKGRGVLVGTSVTCGGFGYSGYVRLWDPRSGEVVWEMNEPGSGRSSRFGDSFADMDVGLEEELLFKLCSKSGDLAVADLRKLSEDPWIYLVEKNPRLSVVGGGRGVGNMAVHCYGKQVFVGRGGELEVWSSVVEKDDDFHEERNLWEGLYRRNFMDKAEDSRRGAIKKIEGGGNRLFVTRESVEGFEVWESSNFSSVVSIV